MMHQQESMSQPQSQSLFINELAEGEEMLWFGTPQAGSRARGGPGAVFQILGTVFGSIGFGLLLVAILLTLLHLGGVGLILLIVFLSVGLPFFVLGIVFTILGLVLKTNLATVYYAITDQRIIIIHPGHSLRVESYGKGEIGQLIRTERADGSGDLEFTRQPASFGYMNNSMNSYNAGYRGAAGANPTSAGRLIGIPNVRSIEHLISRTFKA